MGHLLIDAGSCCISGVELDGVSVGSALLDGAFPVEHVQVVDAFVKHVMQRIRASAAQGGLWGDHRTLQLLSMQTQVNVRVWHWREREIMLQTLPGMCRHVIDIVLLPLLSASGVVWHYEPLLPRSHVQLATPQYGKSHAQSVNSADVSQATAGAKREQVCCVDARSSKLARKHAVDWQVVGRASVHEEGASVQQRLVSDTCADATSSNPYSVLSSVIPGEVTGWIITRM